MEIFLIFWHAYTMHRTLSKSTSFLHFKYFVTFQTNYIISEFNVELKCKSIYIV